MVTQDIDTVAVIYIKIAVLETFSCDDGGIINFTMINKEALGKFGEEREF